MAAQDGADSAAGAPESAGSGRGGAAGGGPEGAPKGRLGPGTAALVELSAALGARDPDAWRPALSAAAERATCREVEEAVLQAYLFVGFPVALAAMAEWRGRTGAGRAEPPAGDGGPSGVPESGPALPGETDTAPPPEEMDDAPFPAGAVEAWTRRGEALCRRVYGSAYGRLRENVRRIHPALDRWMVTEGYGKVLSRPGLEPATRELCIVAILAVTGGEPQLHSHLRGALRLGAVAAEVEAALAAGLERVPDPAVREARLRLWRRVRRREADSEES